MAALFDPLKMGNLTLPNRIVMPPMTRGRARQDGVPTEPMADYYALRADAGLLITEGTCVSPMGRGWSGAPSLYNDDHVRGWQNVTSKVHENGGRIFCQLWFLGRVSHPIFLDGETPWAPSPIQPKQHVHAPSGEKLACVKPHEMTHDNIRQLTSEFAQASNLAVEAGFDGIQIHAASGYIFDQFFRDGANHRNDEYGGSFANRTRLLYETVAACCKAIGDDRVSVRVSTVNQYNDMFETDPAGLFKQVATSMNDFDLAFFEVVEGLPGHFLYIPGDPVLPHIREAYQGIVIANGGYDFDLANNVIANGDADAVSFGIPFVSNPDLVNRFENGYPLSAPDAETFYSPGEPGYLDYPLYDENQKPQDTYKALSLDEARKH